MATLATEAVADERTWDRARRPKLCKLAAVPRLRDLVVAKLAEDWSPEQISGWLARTYPDEHALQVSTETIYRSLFVQTRGVLREELTAHLRSRRTMRRSKSSSTKGQGRGGIVDAISIRERPAEVEDRAVPGRWEGDLIAGVANTHIATLVERQTRFLMLVKVQGKDTTTVVDALAAHVQTLPAQVRASLTWDRGMELAEHVRFKIATDVAVFFCDPQSPWRRGTNENTNGLLRQYFPKKTDLSLFSQTDLDVVAARLNGRPRKTLDYAAPADRFAAVVASTPLNPPHLASREELEGLHVVRTYGAEVPNVEGRDLRDPQPFGERDQRCVHRSEREISIPDGELDDPAPLLVFDGHDIQNAGRDVLQEADLGLCSQSCPREVRDLGDHQRRHEDGTRMRFEERARSIVIRIVGIDVREERAGVGDEPYLPPPCSANRSDSSESICSIRTEMSERPLRPALVLARRRRTPLPRNVSIAVRVSSETVIPRRFASSRSLASRSSGSFTVVLFMVCQHTLP